MKCWSIRYDMTVMLSLMSVSSWSTQQIYGYEDLHMLQSRLPMVSHHCITTFKAHQ